MAVGAEVAGQPATGLPAVISYAEVTPSRSIRPCIPPTGSTTWTTFTTSFRPPRTVPTPRYTVITLACTCFEIIRTIEGRVRRLISITSMSGAWNLFAVEHPGYRPRGFLLLKCSFMIFFLISIYMCISYNIVLKYNLEIKYFKHNVFSCYLDQKKFENLFIQFWIIWIFEFGLLFWL